MTIIQKGEPMSELIRKQDAVDAVNRALDRETLLNRLVRRVAIDAIRIVPPVQSDVPDIYAGELISREAAMERLMAQNVIIDGSEYHNGFNAGVNRAQEVIRNLPTVQPKQTNCEYCHTDRDGYVFPLEKNSHAFIDRDKIVLKAKGWRGEAKIKYCPICGRRLTDG